MEIQPFYKSSLESVSLWGKLTGQRSEKNAVVEINNLLSEKSILEITPSEIQTIVNKYQLNLRNDFTDGSLRELYKAYLHYCFEDNHLDEDEIKRLKHLKRLLALSEKDVEMVHHRVSQEVYERELEVALEDHRLDEKERQFLSKLQNELQLPADVANRLYHHKAQAIIMGFIRNAIADERLSPDEEQDLKVLANHLGVEPDIDIPTQQQLAKYRLLWQLENDQIPSLHVPLELQKDEKCYFLTDAAWHDAPGQSLISQPKPLRARLAEGHYWKPLDSSILDDQINGNRTAQGKLYLTNKRLIYRADNQEKTIPLADILNFQPYSDGVAILRSQSRHVILAIEIKADVFAMLLGRILSNT